MTYANSDFFSNKWFSDDSHIHHGYTNWQTTCILGFERPNLVVQKSLHSAWVTIWCTISRQGILGPYFIEDDAQNPLTVNQECYRDYYCPVCAGFEMILPHQKPATATTVDEARWSYSPHSGGVTCLLEFPFPSRTLDLVAPRCLHMRHAERIRFSIRWPTWKCSRIIGEDMSFFVSLQQHHQHVQQSKGPLWTMCEMWGYTFWTHAVQRRLDMYCIIACYNYILSFLSTFVISVTFVLPHTVRINTIFILNIKVIYYCTWILCRC